MQHIPDSQAAYQPGRSTTEQVFAYKLLAEKAAYQPDRSTTEQVFAYKLLAEKAAKLSQYTSNIILMDMIFWWSQSWKIAERPETKIVERDELHLLKLLLDEVELSVKCGNTVGETFQTNQVFLKQIVSVQFYASPKRSITNLILLDHSYAKPRHLSTPEPAVLPEQDYYSTREKNNCTKPGDMS